ncbi:DUF2834 domain-containing protein [uncultured Chryseobacterium sp.]|uniref:DUF2834 domain-containing protein n=1 Tax=uncultured Chryseobacterium sp. TaxID=259322 RepID=UPI0025D1ED82|nr:DUF2834 domain-containing protein [uncultured Chryseobacterium sp.]
MKYVYLLLLVLGTVLPLSQFFPFVTRYGLNVNLFFSQLFANRISSFFAMDVLVSAVVIIIFTTYESKRLNIKNTWICYAGLLIAGVSCALPLFLYMREKRISASRT